MALREAAAQVRTTPRPILTHVSDLRVQAELLCTELDGGEGLASALASARSLLKATRTVQQLVANTAMVQMQASPSGPVISAQLLLNRAVQVAGDAAMYYGGEKLDLSQLRMKLRKVRRASMVTRPASSSIADENQEMKKNLWGTIRNLRKARKGMICNE